MDQRFGSAVAAFGLNAKAKLANPAARGEPEDQLRAPLEHLVMDLAECCGFPRNAITAVGESSLSEMKTRPDYAVTVRKALVGFIEVKAPGKGADPRRRQTARAEHGSERVQYGVVAVLFNFSPDGRLLLSSDDTGWTYVWRRVGRRGQILALRGGQI